MDNRQLPLALPEPAERPRRGRPGPVHHPEWLAEFEAAYDSELSASSRRVYGAMWQRFVRWAMERGRHPSKVDEALAGHFLADEPFSPNTRKKYHSLLSGIYDAARAAGWCPSNPFQSFDPDYRTRSEEVVAAQALDEADIEKLFASLPKDGDWRTCRDAAMIAALADAGLKVHELRRMQVIDLRDSAGLVTLSVGGKSTTKRSLVLPERSSALFLRYLDARAEAKIQTGLLFPNSSDADATAVTGQLVHLRVKEALARAGFGPSNLAHFGPQVLRASYTYRLSRVVKAPLERVRRALGHVQTTSTMELVERVVTGQRAGPTGRHKAARYRRQTPQATSAESSSQRN